MLFISFLIFSFQVSQAKNKTENIIPITLDGMRWQEVFQGVDNRFFDQDEYISYHNTHQEFKDKYWRESEQERREILFPFLWKTVAKQGQIYGNRTKGSKADITNFYHFSYPGYNEILTGFADPEIGSNDKVLNQNWTFLEWLEHQKEYKGKTAAFASWDVFPYIIHRQRSGVYMNTGFDQMDILLDNPLIKELNQLQLDIPIPWDTVRFDAYTYHFAFEYLKAKRPKALYISLGETDDFAHDGEYDRYINSAKKSDEFISRIWHWVQNDPDYKDKTTLLITTDHGRGYVGLEQWKSHGLFNSINEDSTTQVVDMTGDTEIWIAVIGPDTPPTGEMQNIADVKQSQIAKTLVKFLGLDYQSSHKTLKAGEPIELMFKQ
jgi:hypothetical protein